MDHLMSLKNGVLLGLVAYWALMVTHPHDHLREDGGPLKVVSSLLSCFNMLFSPPHTQILWSAVNVHAKFPRLGLLGDNDIHDTVV